MSRDRMADLRAGGGTGGGGSNPSLRYHPRGDSRGQQYSSDVELGPVPSYPPPSQQQQMYNSNSTRRITPSNSVPGNMNDPYQYRGNGNGNGNGNGSRSRAASSSSMGNSIRGGGSWESEVKDVQGRMREIESQMQALTSLQSQSFTATRTTDQKEIRMRIDQLNDTINTNFMRTRERVKGIYVKQQHKGLPDSPARKNQQAACAKALTDLASQFQKQQITYKATIRDRLEREYRIVKPAASKEEIDDYVNNPSSNQAVFSSAMMGRAQAAYKEVKERHEQIIRIEASMNEMVQLFQDMQILLDTQQEKLDAIDVRVEETNQQLGEASKEMTQAIISRKRARKRAWCICVCVIILLIILGVVLYIYVIKPAIAANNAVSK